MNNIKICLKCLELTGQLKDGKIICSTCGHIENRERYEELLKECKKAVKYGYQYRVTYENDIEKDPELNCRYAVIELHQIFEFLALAVISGVVGNFAYDKLKNVFNRIIKNPLIIQIKDKEFKKFLENENEQVKFIRYIEQYRNNNLQIHPKVIQAIKDEKTADEASDYIMNLPALKKLISDYENIETSRIKKVKKSKKNNKKIK